VDDSGCVIATVIGDGKSYAVYLGLTKRCVVTSAFAHAKGRRLGAVRTVQEETKDDEHVVLYHAVSRLGVGAGTVDDGARVLLGHGHISEGPIATTADECRAPPVTLSHHASTAARTD
jgi:hypothetical protein